MKRSPVSSRLPAQAGVSDRARASIGATDPGSPPEAALDDALRELASPVLLPARGRSSSADPPAAATVPFRLTTEPHALNAPRSTLRMAPEATPQPPLLEGALPSSAPSRGVAPGRTRLAAIAGVFVFACLCAAGVAITTRHEPLATATATMAVAPPNATTATAGAGSASPVSVAPSAVPAVVASAGESVALPPATPATSTRPSAASARPAAARPAGSPPAATDVRRPSPAMTIATSATPSSPASSHDEPRRDPPPKNDGPGSLQ